MKKYLPVLKKSKLFDGLIDTQIISILECFNAKVKSYGDKEIVFSQENTANLIGIILSGAVEIQKLDYDGNINIISTLYSPNIIGAAAFFSSNKALPFDAVSQKSCTLLTLDGKRLIGQCSKACSMHTKIIENLIKTIADKNFELTQKIDILTKRTTREKLLAFLYARSRLSKSKKFSITLTRRQLADYLSINRSAMIRELSLMKNEGLIDFEDNIFWFR